MKALLRPLLALAMLVGGGCSSGAAQSTPGGGGNTGTAGAGTGVAGTGGSPSPAGAAGTVGTSGTAGTGGTGGTGGSLSPDGAAGTGGGTPDGAAGGGGASPDGGADAPVQPGIIIQEDQPGFAAVDGKIYPRQGSTSITGFTGTGFADGDPGMGKTIAWSVKAETAGRTSWSGATRSAARRPTRATRSCRSTA